MAKNRFTQEIGGEKTRDTFILLSSGYHKGCPIPFKTRGNSFVIDLQIEEISKRFKYADIIVALGYESYSVLEHINKKFPNVRIVENTRYQETTSLESLRIGLNAALAGNVYAIHGDILFTAKSLLMHGNYPMIPVRRNESKSNKLGTNVGVLQDDKGFVRNLSYGLKDEWAEMLYIPKDLFYKSKSLIKESRGGSHLFEFVNDLLEVTNVVANVINNKEAENIKD